MVTYDFNLIEKVLETQYLFLVSRIIKILKCCGRCTCYNLHRSLKDDSKEQSFQLKFLFPKASDKVGAKPKHFKVIVESC